jgi:hypothetical protein
MTPEQSVRRTDWAALRSVGFVFVRICLFVFGRDFECTGSCSSDKPNFAALRSSYERIFAKRALTATLGTSSRCRKLIAAWLCGTFKFHIYLTRGYADSVQPRLAVLHPTYSEYYYYYYYLFIYLNCKWVSTRWQ